MTGRANHAGQVSVPNVILRFSYIRHRSLPPELLIVCRRAADSDVHPQVPIHSPVT